MLPYLWLFSRSNIYILSIGNLNLCDPFRFILVFLYDLLRFLALYSSSICPVTGGSWVSIFTEHFRNKIALRNRLWCLRLSVLRNICSFSSCLRSWLLFSLVNGLKCITCWVWFTLIQSSTAYFFITIFIWCLTNRIRVLNTFCINRTIAL